MSKKLIRTAFFSALGELAYISLVALVMYAIGKFFGEKPDPAIIAPIAFLLMFVISAAVSGFLILGKPLMLYLDGQKKEAVQLFGLTIGWLAVFLFFTLLVIAAV